MNEQVTPEFVSRPLNRPVQPGPTQGDPARKLEPDPAAGPVSGQAAPGDNQPGAAACAQAGPADDRKGAWTSAGAGSKAGTEGDDVSQLRRDDRYLAVMVASVARAAGEDGQGDLALAREIHAVVEPKDIYDRWLVEDLFHSTRELTRYRTQRVELPKASRFKALVTLLMPFKSVFKREITKIALDYLAPEPEERKRAQNLLRTFEISDPAINAQAAELHEKTIAALDRLIAQNQTRRSGTVKERKQDKRRADKAKAKKSNLDQPDQTELALH